MCETVVRSKIKMPRNATLASTNQLVYQFPKVEEDDMTTPFNVVGVLIGAMPKGLVEQECSFEVVDNNYLVVSAPCPSVLYDVHAIVEALSAHGITVTPETNRYLGISQAIDELARAEGTPSHSVYVIELPFPCNKKLYYERNFPGLRFLEFIPPNAKESVVFLHVQLRSFREVVSRPNATASTATSMTTKVDMRRRHGSDGCQANGAADRDGRGLYEYPQPSAPPAPSDFSLPSPVPPPSQPAQQAESRGSRVLSWLFGGAREEDNAEFYDAQTYDM